MITLEVLAGEKAGATFELDLPLLTLGRAPSNQVVLSDYHLSGEHGQIFREDDRYIYRDLKSTNGSRVRRAGTEISLDDGTHETMLADGERGADGRVHAPAEDNDGADAGGLRIWIAHCWF